MFSFNHYHLLRVVLAQVAKSDAGKHGSGEMVRLSQEDWTGIHAELNGLELADKKELLDRFEFYQSGFKNCFGLKHKGRVAHLQWIIYPSENDLLLRNFKGRYAPLRQRQIMFENAFTLPSFRDPLLFKSGLAQLMGMASEQGYTNAVSYVRKDNLDMLNDLLEMGFQLIQIIPEYKFFGWVRRSVR